MAEIQGGSAHITKKRKIQRACDYCREKKIKCDGPQMPNQRCSKCYARRMECTYTEHPTKHYSSSYVEGLESRLERMEKLMKQLCPDGQLPPEATYRPELKQDLSRRSSSETSHPEGGLSPMSTSALAVTPQTPGSSEDLGSSSDDDEHQIVEGLRELTVDPQVYRYYGKSSSLVFLRSAVTPQRRYAQDADIGQERPRPWLLHNVQEDLPVFTDFPPDDLLDALVEEYFRNLNDYMPVLHEPTFKKAIADGLHLRHGSFGGTVLLVCANGARCSRDPRIYAGGPEEWQSAGWEWYERVDKARRVPLGIPQLYDLQMHVLMVLFMRGMRTLQGLWPLIGMGIRMAVEGGVHRRKRYGLTPTVEGELWRRAFWVLVCLEWGYAYGLGRPSSIHAEDMDLELPMEVDDEYWTTREGQPLFKQPPGKPSKISFFVQTIKLTQVLTFASRTIYSTNKARAQLGQGDMERWEERVVAELDSALNKWTDALPEHLRWDPNREDPLFFNQAGVLHGHQQHFKIAIHRPFISGARRVSIPSVAICTTAARTALQTIEVVCNRIGTPHHTNMGTLFMALMVLLVNIINQKRLGKTVNTASDMAYVKRGMDMLDSMKHEQHVCEVLCALLGEMLTVAKAPVEPHARMQTNATSSTPAALADPSPSHHGGPSPGGSAASSRPSQTDSSPAMHVDSGPSGTPTTTPSGGLQSGTQLQSQGSQAHFASGLSAPASASNQGHDLLSGHGQYGGSQYPSNAPASLGFGVLEYGQAMSLFPTLSRPESAPANVAEGYSYPPSLPFDPAMAALMNPPGIVNGDGVQPEGGSVFIDHGMNTWMDTSPFRWDDWSAYVNNANDRNYTET